LKKLTRKEAKATGEYFYYTGTPCKHGHDGYRYTNNAMCVACAKHYRKKHEESAEKKRERYLRNKEFVLESKKEYYQENREKIRKKQKVYCDANKEKLRESNKKWRTENYERHAHNCRMYRYRKYQAVPSWLTIKDRNAITETYAQCKKTTKETGVQHHVDHIIPINGKAVSGLHVPWNLQVVPASYNLSKKNKVMTCAAHKTSI